MTTNADPSNDASEGKRRRSPSYPFIPLPKALERAKSLYEKAGSHEVGVEQLADAWGYGLRSSGLVQSAAALIQFGLLTGRGARAARRFQLSPEAVGLVSDGAQAPVQNRAALRRLALSPPIFQELAHRFGGRDPSDAELKRYLTQDRREAGQTPFSDGAAEEAVSRFRATLGYVGMDLPDLPPGGMDQGRYRAYRSSLSDHVSEPSAQGVGGGVHEPGERVLLAGLLGRETSYRIVVRGPVGVKEMDRLLAKLQLDRDIFAEDETASGEPDA